jgi:uncharacterized protein YeaO (DUF488 family)
MKEDGMNRYGIHDKLAISTRQHDFKHFVVWIRSYDCELQRQSCKNLQWNKLTSAFQKQKKILLEKQQNPTYNNASVEVVGLAPGIQPS